MSAERTFIVATRTATPQAITCVAEIDVGAHGELVLKDSDGGCCAIFAAGEWLRATPAEGDDA